MALWLEKQLADVNSILSQKLRRVERDTITAQVSRYALGLSPTPDLFLLVEDKGQGHTYSPTSSF